VDFYTSCTNGIRNEYSTEQLQNLQLYRNYWASTLLIKLKPHKTSHFEVSCHSILLLNSTRESELNELYF